MTRSSEVPAHGPVAVVPDDVEIGSTVHAPVVVS